MSQCGGLMLMYLQHTMLHAFHRHCTAALCAYCRQQTAVSWELLLGVLSPVQFTGLSHLLSRLLLQCSSTAAAAEIKDDHWYVADQPRVPGMLHWRCCTIQFGMYQTKSCVTVWWIYGPLHRSCESIFVWPGYAACFCNAALLLICSSEHNSQFIADCDGDMHYIRHQLSYVVA